MTLVSTNNHYAQQILTTKRKWCLVHDYFRQFLKPFQALLMYNNAELPGALPPGPPSGLCAGPVGGLTAPPKPPAAFGTTSACTQAASVTHSLP